MKLALIIPFLPEYTVELKRVQMFTATTNCGQAISANVEPSTEVQVSLLKFVVHLCNTLMRIETKSKRGRHVPVLLAQDIYILAAVTALVAKRELARVSSEFLFGRPGDSASPFSTWVPFLPYRLFLKQKRIYLVDFIHLDDVIFIFTPSWFI